MPWSGSGTYVLPPAYSPEVNGTVIDATRYNGLTTDVANGISNAIAKDGQNVPTANLPMGGFKHTGVADGNGTGQYLAYNQATAARLTTLGLGIAPAAVLQVQLADETGGGSNQGVSLVGAGSTRQLNLGVNSTSGVPWIQAWQPGTGAATLTLQPSGGNIGISMAPNGLANIGTSVQVKGLSGAAAGHISVESNDGLSSVGLYSGVTSADTAVISYQTGLRFGTAGNAGVGSFSEKMRLTLGGGVVLSNPTSGIQLSGTSAVDTTQVDFQNTLTTNANAHYSARNDAGNVIALVIPGTAAATYGTRLANEGNLYSNRPLVIMADNASADIKFATGGNAEKFRMTDDGRFLGQALHNNPGAMTGTTNQYVGSGTYTPTYPGGGTNITGVTPNAAQWIRVGNVVTVSGTVDVDPNSINALTIWTLTLPIASSITATNQLAGTANAVDGNPTGLAAIVLGNVAGDTAQFNTRVNADVTSVIWTYTYTYVVL
jgi:hypothetical protein